jgi:hypothetical protein
MAWPPVLDILIYTMVLSGAPAPATCEAKSEELVACSTGATGKYDPRTDMVSVNGTPVFRRNGRYEFGNGMTGARNAMGWTVFTNGVLIRRNVLGGDPDAYLINPDLICENVSDRKAACRKR